MITTRPYPQVRLRRLRKHSWLRTLTQENRLCAHELILPLFVHDQPTSIAIPSLPSVYRYCLDLVSICRRAQSAGIQAVALFRLLPALKMRRDQKHLRQII